MRHWRVLPVTPRPKTDNSKTRILKPITGDNIIQSYRMTPITPIKCIMGGYDVNNYFFGVSISGI